MTESMIHVAHSPQITSLFVDCEKGKLSEKFALFSVQMAIFKQFGTNELL
jgi:hypothetical protein